ncbi:DUF4347 domain-containing protein [Salaquimonas pukyongi]|uniref:DUF4347 domain-containing protein n=1 Tax=Salaquimonas pukyongi TaxID=2712698 RepID=UPI00096B78DC|nr:DUF4347 domain-containing protein [Salaquimonas pukyongi]
MGIKSSFFAKARSAASGSGIQCTDNPATRQAGGAMRPGNGNEAVFLESGDGLLLRALEPRILLDAAGVETGIDLAEKMAMEAVAQRFPDSPAAAIGSAPDADANSDTDEDPAATGDGTATPVEIVFVDGSIKNLNSIMAGIGPEHEAVYLSGDMDGVSQIAGYLADRNDVAAIHIFAHGRSGTLELGDAKLTAASIKGKHADEMVAIRGALSDDADILIYGCNFAAGTRGQTAVNALMEASGADVSASTDTTGAAVLGGDWDLEVSAGEIEAASLAAEAWDGLLASGGGADDNGGGSGIAITGNVTENIDVLANDTVSGAALLTQIIDPSDPGNPQALAVGVPVQLTTNTAIELLADGTLDVTTSPLGQGLETFDYVFTDAGSGGQATVTLDRTQGSLINVPATASGTEDNNVPLGITIDPALTAGGSQLDLISTETAFRDASAGATPTDFTIPPRTTAIRISGFGGEDNSSNAVTQEHRQIVSVTVDLIKGTYSGHILHVLAQGTNANDSYAFSGVTLGNDSTSGTLTGTQNNNVLTVSRSGDTLSLVESQTSLDQAYLVEYLTADGSSSDYLGSSGAILDQGTTAAETTATIAADPNANFLVINIQDGRGTNDAKQEDNGGGRIVVDLETGLASGVLYGQTGRGSNHNNAYSFSGYDITSGAFIVDPGTRNATAAGGATVVGDTTASLNRLPNYIISMSGNDLVLERSSNHASLFEELISVQSFERYDIGSSARTLSSDAVVSTYVDDGTLATWDLDIAGGAETGNITLTAVNLGGASSGEHDHGATARIFVDLVNGTTSGSFFLIRADNPDLIVWTDVPFGQRLTDAIGTNAEANFNNLNQTTIDLVGALRFNLITNPDGSQTLHATARSNGNNDSGQEWSTVMQAQWSGREPVTISGYPTGGTFSAGSLNPNTGQWEVEADNIAGMEFIPPEHFSGQTTTMLVDYNGDQHNVTVNISRVADAPTLSTTDQSGDEDTAIDISGAFAASLVDTDGSETITLLELSNIPVGHTISDGTNTFTAAAGSQIVDIASWNIATLTYTGGANFVGTVTLNVRARSTDVDGFTATPDTAEILDSFDIIIANVNDAPTGADNTFTIVEDTSYTFSAGDFGFADPDDTPSNSFDAIIITTLPSAADGELTLSGTPVTPGQAIAVADIPNLIFTPATDRNGNGVGAFTFQVKDDGGTADGGIDTDQSPNTIQFDITPVNDAPVNTVPGAQMVTEDTSLSIPGISVTDIDGNLATTQLSVTSGTLAVDLSGGATINAGTNATNDLTLSGTEAEINAALATLSYHGNADFNGSDTLSVLSTDNDGTPLSDTDTVAITVTPINDAPVGVDDGPVAVTEDIPATGNVLANDTDIDNTPAELSVTQFTVDTVAGTFSAGDTAAITGVGTLTIAADGAYTFTPASGYNGPVPSATYTVSDGALTGTAVLSFSDVGAVNDDPVAQDDVLTTPEDTTLNANLLADNGNGADSDPDSGDTLTIASATIDTNGDGSQDTLMLGNATAISDNASNPVGTITVEASGALTFVPAADYNGAVPPLTYTLSDGNGGSNTATATISVTPVNDAPQLNLDTDNDSGTPGDPADDGTDDGGFEVTFNENDSPVPIVDTDLLIADPDDDILEIVVTLTDGKAGDTINFPNTLPGNVSATAMPAPTLAADGTLTLTLTGDASTTVADWTAILQALSFTPSASSPNNPDPADRHFMIQASDSAMAASTARNTVVHVVPLNDVPTLDLDADDSSGINAGNYRATYVEGAAAEAISDGALITDLDNTHLAGLTVVLTNGEAGDALSIGTLPAGIALAGGAPAELTAAGTITVTLTGSASTADYQSAIAAIGFANASDDPATGVREITVTATDGEDATPVRTAFITVEAVNDAPGIVDPGNPGTPPADPNDIIPDQSGVDSAALAALNASAYFHDPDSATLTYSLGGAAPAWLSINPATGVITGTPPANASQNSNIAVPGSYDVLVIAEDPDGATGQTTVTYTVANPAPSATNDVLAIAEGAGSAAANVITADNGHGVDSDPDGDALSVAAVNGVSGDVGSAVTGDMGGLFTINANGAFTFAENGDFDDLAGGETRTTSVSYTLSDGEGDSRLPRFPSR